jgi:hypothetical protein
LERALHFCDSFSILFPIDPPYQTGFPTIAQLKEIVSRYLLHLNHQHIFFPF